MKRGNIIAGQLVFRNIPFFSLSPKNDSCSFLLLSVEYQFVIARLKHQHLMVCFSHNHLTADVDVVMAVLLQ